MKSITTIELKKCIEVEEYALGLLSTSQKIGEEKGKKEGLEEGIKIEEEKRKEDNILNVLINFFNEKKENYVFENLIDIVDKENIAFRSDKIKKKIKEEKNYKEFISLLGKKRKII